MFRNGKIRVFLCALLASVPLGITWADVGYQYEFSGVNTHQLHPGGKTCFTTHAPSVGLLMLEVNVPNAAQVEPKLEFFGRVCDGTETFQSVCQFRERLASSAMIHIRQAGDYRFCVEAQDPSLELGEFQLINGFLAAAIYKTDPDEDEPEPDPFGDSGGCSIEYFDQEVGGGIYKTDPDEDEPEPDPFVGTDSCSIGDSMGADLGDKLVEEFVGGGIYKTDPDEDEPEPDPFAGAGGCSIGEFSREGLGGEPSDEFVYGGIYKTDPDEDEPEPDPFADTSCRSGIPRSVLDVICRQNKADDHSDSLGCATLVALGQEIGAEIRSDLGQDRDLFGFLVKKLTSVRAETSGGSDTLGSLYDRHGNRLRVNDDGGREANFRIVKTLKPGRYFIRVEGAAGAEGAYRLVLEDLGSTE